MLRIGFVIESLTIGGAEILLLNFIQRLDKSEYQIFVYTLFEKDLLKSDFEKAGVKMREIRPRGFRLFWKIIELSRLMIKDKLSIVHTHLCDADLYGRIAARLAGVKIILSTEHSLDPWKTSRILKYRIRTILDLLTIRFCKTIICVSKAVRDYHVRWGIPPYKIRVIYPSKPYVPAVLSKDNMRKELNIFSDDFIITTVGRLCSLKNQIGLIRAACAVLNIHSNIKFVIVGDGPLRNELLKQVSNSNYKEKILLLGLRNNVSDILHMSDIFVLPSFYEGFPMTIIEAMQCGLPVIASNVGGIPEIVDDETGILINPVNVDEITNAILWLYENPGIRTHMKKAAIKRVNEMFNFDNHVHKILSLYKEIMIQK